MAVYEVSDLHTDEVYGTLTTDAKGVIVSHTMTGDDLMDGAVQMKETLAALMAHGGPGVVYTEVGGKKPSLADAIAKARANNARRGDVQKDDEVEITFTGTGLISKADEAQQIVYGWAYVTHDRAGNIAVDKSGDFVDDVEQIEKTAVKFMINSRNTDVGHNNTKSGTIVESMVFTPEKIEKMGIPVNTVPLGWWIGTKVDDATWAEYKAGRLTAFSVHGKGVRSKIAD